MGLHKSWRRGREVVHAVRGAEIEILPNEFVAIRGRSGSGKSTLLQLLAGLERPDRGELLYSGRDIARFSNNQLNALRRHHFGFMFQDFNLIPTLSAIENVECALATTRVKAAAREQTAVRLLDELGLSQRRQHLPSQLSGGEQQRVALARALANSPKIVYADEPTGSLDSSSAAEVLGLLRGFADRGAVAVVMVTHDPVAASYADRIVTMSDGRLDSGSISEARS